MSVQLPPEIERLILRRIQAGIQSILEEHLQICPSCNAEFATIYTVPAKTNANLFPYPAAGPAIYCSQCAYHFSAFKPKAQKQIASSKPTPKQFTIDPDTTYNTGQLALVFGSSVYPKLAALRSSGRLPFQSGKKGLEISYSGKDILAFVEELKPGIRGRQKAPEKPSHESYPVKHGEIASNLNYNTEQLVKLMGGNYREAIREDRGNGRLKADSSGNGVIYHGDHVIAWLKDRATESQSLAA